MASTTLGTWRNPPLAYVVAEVAISPYYSIGSAVPQLQDALRASYPRTIEGQGLVVDLNTPPKSQPFWHLMSADQQQAVQLSVRTIGLHVTSYLHSKDFLSRWAEVLDAVNSANLGVFVERAGLRYVDLIVPTGGRTPTDYLAPGLQGVTAEETRPQSSIWSGSFALDESLVNVQTAAPSPKGALLPPNFNALPLQKPKVMVEAETRIKEQQPIGFIDTDCLRTVQRKFDTADLVDIYATLQKLASKTFRALISPIAQEEWI